MVIEKGKDWGEPAPLPADGVVVRSDAEARLVIDEHRRANRPVPTLGLLGGDLCRTLGGTGDESRLRSEAARTLPVDLGAVLLDGRLLWFVSSLVVRPGAWWRGRAWVVMNGQWLGRWNVAPRAHPNDGRLDVLDIQLPPGQRQAVWRRLPSGTHLPHPGIRTERTTAIQREWDKHQAVYLDGQLVGVAKHVSVRVEPDALTVVV